ncbi:hypothetical protein SSX86_023713 [Deinandra increscens subsp. villosa]|uniref:ADP-ribosyl cyclase/cyclic ADP-ribose hydrolase n=1 Tax=Deinandra increscens subsp. villosa TaxID=3103831 RepID=A0AAP0CT97_9ASTR
MASSSSLASSRLIHAFSFKSWDHDVFLSFRGEDTRKTFVDHLYKALKQQGIHTYKDDETLPRGESIGPSLLHAIQESRIAVVIFSEKYADSSWCLDELAYIMECRDTRGQIVMPVFYDVDPSDVRKQTGKYGEAFENKHELENKHKVESWRKALANAGNLSGWVPKDIANGHEAKCIEEIVRAVNSRLSQLSSDDNKDDLIGMETRSEELVSKLKIGSGGVRFVGVWGLGGSGKTVLASFAYEKISKHFDDHYILENIRYESSQAPGLKGLQEKLLSRILQTEVKLDSEQEGRRMIERRFSNKSVLIVLDDVDDLKQLEQLAGGHNWFGEGSRIMITTRDENVLTHYADEIYTVSLLSEDEAIKLFHRHAYREDKPIEDYESLSQDVVSYAGGLPLALKILGSSLYDKDKNEWMSALAKLRDIPSSEIMKKLKISYDALEPDERELFLDIACVLRRWPLDKAKMILDCNFHTVIGVKVLVQKSLINVSNGTFDMHDLIEEMAHYIVTGEHHDRPEKLSRVWRVKDVLDICYVDTTMVNDETKVLVLPPRLPHDVTNMNRLWMFDYPTSLPSHVTDPRLPPVVANMKKLRWIYWEGYPESSLPINFQPINLGCLMLIMGRQKELWKGCKQLPHLKILDLRYSKYLKRTPDFNGLPLLERLNLKACVLLEEIHPSIGFHKRLAYITMIGCSKVKMFPPIISMENLETLKLSECEGLKRFPVIQTNMDRLKKLCLDGTPIEIVPASVGQFCTNLASLDLNGCIKLKTIEGNFRLLKSLKYLNLQSCRQLENLAENFFDVECCLDVLSLSTKRQDSTFFKNVMNCMGLHFFHKESSVKRMKFPKLPRYLTKLTLSWCNIGDGDIPTDICQLLNLQELDLSLNKFSRLDSSLSGIPHLKSLDLTNCYNLVELPDLPLSICILKATDCDSLKSVGDLSKYKCLWKVSLWREHKLIGGERALRSMLQGNVDEDRFMSVTLPGGLQVTNAFPYISTYTLQLPQNWYNDFSGILLCADNLQDYPYKIFITETPILMDSQPDHWEEFDKNPESYDYALVGYVPFSSLQNTLWWNSTYTAITIHMEGIANPKVALVPRISKGDSRVRAKSAIEFSDEEVEVKNTFRILSYSKLAAMVVWTHGGIGSSFIPTETQVPDGLFAPALTKEPDESEEEAKRIYIEYKKLYSKETRKEIKRST